MWNLAKMLVLIRPKKKTNKRLNKQVKQRYRKLRKINFSQSAETFKNPWKKIDAEIINYVSQ